jgi:sortase A
MNRWVEDMIVRLNKTASKGWPTIAGFCATALGMVLVAIFAGAAIHREVSSRWALREFDKTHLSVGPESREAPAGLLADQEVDFSLWSKGRIAAYRDNLRTKRGSPVAVLRFERLNIRVPVFEGTDDWTLNRGAGWIAGTTPLGEAGNIGIAGHRDSFFRVLKDIRQGDAIELISATRTSTYTVSQVEIVDPDNVSVLQPGREPCLTLVTCYPFYFVGPAPRRFILHAGLSKQAPIEEFAN